MTVVDEAVRCVRGGDNDLTRADSAFLPAGDEQRLALLDDEDLLVRVLVEAWAATGWRLDEDDADARVVIVADQFAGERLGRKLCKPDDLHGEPTYPKAKGRRLTVPPDSVMLQR